MSRGESKVIRGGLTQAQVNQLSPEVRAARAAYLSDSGAQLETMFDSGVTELRSDDPDKDVWSGKPKNAVESLDLLLEVGYQIDTDGNVYEPDFTKEHHRTRR